MTTFIANCRMRFGGSKHRNHVITAKYKARDMKYVRLKASLKKQLEAEPLLSTVIRKIADEFGKDHELAMDLWSAGTINHRLLAVLLMDRKQLTRELLEALIRDIEALEGTEIKKLSDWLLANQLVETKIAGKEIEGWISNRSVTRQRMFWSYCARTMRKKKAALPNASALLEVLERQMAASDPLVQETMNWCAAEIGILEETLRRRCIALGKRLGLYKDYPVSKGCTSPYLPIWIEEMVARGK